ncbi:hypothetical protein DFP72DRAFT_1070143 [Ephemerocybe angulata]|uniref:Uncharacterized protein n=1 Tax=Ephemerocybe angulata TaxID=980116 RepID=A0A8H6HSV4_9AGAR|nr:hypothetical protein DFP72DRAFT_1070143 [Tulosesus angulatus]
MSSFMNRTFTEHLEDFPLNDNPFDTQEPAQGYGQYFLNMFSSLYTPNHNPWNPDDRSGEMAEFLSSPGAKDSTYRSSGFVLESLSQRSPSKSKHLLCLWVTPNTSRRRVPSSLPEAEVNETTIPTASKTPAETDTRTSQELELLPISQELGPNDAMAVVETSSTPDTPRSGLNVTSDEATEKSTPLAELSEPSPSPMARTHVGETSVKRKRSEEIAHHDSAEPKSSYAVADESSDTPVFKRPNLGNAPSTSDSITPRVSTSPHPEVMTGSVRTTPDQELSVASSPVFADAALENPATAPPVHNNVPAAATIAHALTVPAPESPATPELVPATPESHGQPTASSSAVDSINPASEAPARPSVAPPASLPYTTVFVPKAADWWYGPVTNEVARCSQWTGNKKCNDLVRNDRDGWHKHWASKHPGENGSYQCFCSHQTVCGCDRCSLKQCIQTNRKITRKPNAPSQGIGSHILKYHTSQKSEKKVCFGKGCMTHVPSGEEAFCGKSRCKREYDLARADWLAAGN